MEVFEVIWKPLKKHLHIGRHHNQEGIIIWHVCTASSYMSQYTSKMDSFFKDSDKIVRLTKFLAWKKLIFLTLAENEFMWHSEGTITHLEKEKTQESVKYMKGEIKSQRILIESIKGHIITFVIDLTTSKAIYEKFVKLYSISTPGQKISLRN